MKTLKLLLLVSVLAGCGQQEPPPKNAFAVRPETSIPKPPEKTAALNPQKKEEDRLNAENLQAAIRMTVPYMNDFVEEKLSDGAIVLAHWASTDMKWGELLAVESGKYAVVMKDSDSQRGKRLCTKGVVIEIHADKSLPKKVFTGGMFDEVGHLYRFLAVGSTGEIVGNSPARFCGVVTGRNDYQNSVGGVAHAVHVIGMFDLPENKAR